MLIIDDRAEALIFDCDGTLVDSMTQHIAAWRQTFTALGLSLNEPFLLQFNGVPTPKIVAAYNAAFGLTLDSQMVAAEKDRRAFALLNQAKAFEPVARLARQAAGKLPMAVVSGGARKNVERSLDAIGMKELFATIITADDPLPPKPAPDGFLEAARRLGVRPPLCQVFEDGDLGLEGARRAKMIATDVRPFIEARANTVEVGI